MKPSIASQLFLAMRSLLASAAFVTLWVWLALSVRVFDSRIPVAVPAWTRPLGYLLFVAGAILAALCIVTFAARGQGTPAPFDPPRKFVASGPYRFVRNPMYIGAIGAISGGGLIVGSVSIVALAVAFFAITHVFVVVYEEPTLTQQFGDSYLRYKATVPRWWISRRKAAASRGDG